VFFAAAWCGPCKQLKAVVETVAEKHSNLKVVEYDVDAEQGQTIAYGVRGIPTLILFKNGSRAETVTGYQSVASVERMLVRHLDKAA
jgi:thioredoxin 1